jgi:8-amino-7-oxononanoate synthase
MREPLLERVLASRAQREALSRRRRMRIVNRRDGMRCEVDGEWLQEFCGNDYLGLSREPRVVAALRDGAQAHGAGATASHLVCGHTATHEALERELADWLQAPRALLFGSGFMANLGVVQALLGYGDTCVQDKLNHASLIDAARLSGCMLKRYPHADVDAAERQLLGCADGAAMLASDGVFSMDGDPAPLHALSAVAQRQQATLYVDDAHGVGVLGPDGRGSVAAAGLNVRDVPLQLVTFGKALGSYGAAVVGDEDLIAHLVETARPHIYTTALSPAQAAATHEAVRVARSRDGHALRETLQLRIDQLREGARSRGLELMPSHSAIQPMLCGSDVRAMALAAALEQRGYWVAPIRPPTVPEGQARLRITVSAMHSASDVEGLLEALAQANDMVSV